ncbi:MAG: VOC family protein [Acidimicrobiia bacterium]|nr:VOC family protein [Acidimicrobiia bacterium]MDX2467837.1 VOC family protein [Acidimicrobiia bacterium]
MSIPIQVTFDAFDPMALAEFWAAALGYVLQPPPAGFASWDEFADANNIPVENRNDLAAIVDPNEVGPRVLFQRVPEVKSAKNRVHLDVNAGGGHDVEYADRVDAVDRHVDHLVDLGATKIETFGQRGYWVVMQDPEGNEFCVQ